MVDEDKGEEEFQGIRKNDNETCIQMSNLLSSLVSLRSAFTSLIMSVRRCHQNQSLRAGRFCTWLKLTRRCFIRRFGWHHQLVGVLVLTGCAAPKVVTRICRLYLVDHNKLYVIYVILLLLIIINVKTSQFLNYCRSRINRIKQQKLALPMSPTLDSCNCRQLIQQT